MAFSSYFGHRTEGFVAHPFYAITACSLCLLAVLNTITAYRRIVWTLRQFRRDQVAILRDPVAPPPAQRMRRENDKGQTLVKPAA